KGFIFQLLLFWSFKLNVEIFLSIDLAKAETEQM
ncbi:hypothetical protein LCGC14_2273640, partial [marine sediment metagenome]